jgi:hypothetical protein
VDVTNQELSAMVFVAGYGVLLLIAVKIFGLRRVLWAVGLVVVLAIAVAFRTLGAVTGGRRY